MRKHRYQAKEIQRADWARVREAVAGQRVVFGVDVAKTDFFGALMVSKDEVVAMLRWKHPEETRVLGGLLGSLGAERIEVVLEPSGTYGDSLRAYLSTQGATIWLASPKRVHDAARKGVQEKESVPIKLEFSGGGKVGFLLLRYTGSVGSASGGP